MNSNYISLSNAMYRKMVVISFILILAKTLTFGQEIPQKDNSENMFNHKWSNNGYLDLNTVENSIFSITTGSTNYSQPFKNNIRTEDLGFLEKNSSYLLRFIVKTSFDFPLVIHYGEEDINNSQCIINKKIDLKSNEDFTIQTFEFKTNDTISNSHLVFGFGYAPKKASIILTAVRIEKVK